MTLLLAIMAFVVRHWMWIAPLAVLILLLVGFAAGGRILAALRWAGRTIAADRKFFVLLAVAAAGAALYVWGVQGRADRDAVLAWANTVCASAGAELQPPKGVRGTACANAIADLARFRRETNEQTAQLLIEDAQARSTKMAADAQSARRSADAAAAARQAMETANANVGTDDRVGSDWLAAFNRLAGLRVD